MDGEGEEKAVAGCWTSRSGRSQIRTWPIKITSDLDSSAWTRGFPTRIFALAWVACGRLWGSPDWDARNSGGSHRRFGGRSLAISLRFPSSLPSFPRSPPSPTPNGPSHTPQRGHSVPHHLHIPHTLIAPSTHHMIHTPGTSDTRRTRRRPVLALFCYRLSSGVPNTLLPTVLLPQSTAVHMPLPAPPPSLPVPYRVPIHFAPSGSPASHLCPLPSLPLPQSIP